MGADVHTNTGIEATSTTFDGNDTGLKLGQETGSWVKATVRGCAFAGNGDGICAIDIGDSAVVIRESTIEGNATSGIVVDSPGDVRIVRNTITGNTAGVFCDNYATAVVESSMVTQNVKGVNITYNASADLGQGSGGGSAGYNMLGQNTSYFVFNGSANQVSARVNYWNGLNPQTGNCGPKASKIYGSVDSGAPLCDPPDYESNMVVIGGGGGNSEIPTKFALNQNHPNPFNPTTMIAFDVPRPGARVEISVYDVTGRLVTTLVDDQKAPGAYSVTWDGRNRRGQTVATGMYFMRMRAGSFVETRKLLMLK